MAHRGTRSIKGRQKRDVHKFLHSLNFNDRILCEKIFTVTKERLATLLIKKYDYVELEAIQLFDYLIRHNELGDVLTDSRGTGTQQQVPAIEPLNLRTISWR